MEKEKSYMNPLDWGKSEWREALEAGVMAAWVLLLGWVSMCLFC